MVFLLLRVRWYVARPPRLADFFRVWAPEMAYVLGYWWADGCIYVKPCTTAHEVRIASNDLEHLLTIAQAINQTYDLRKVSPHKNTYVLTYCSVEMYRDIEGHGGTPRKSKTISFPEVPAALLPHFVRGLTDGDGTLALNGDRPILQIYSGSSDCLNRLTAAVERLTGIPAPNLQTNRDNWAVKWSTIRAKCLAAWLYIDNPGLALERKAAIAAQFLQWQPRKKPEKGTITDGMRRNFPGYLPV